MLQMHTMAIVAGLTGAGLSLLGTGFYLRDIRRGVTRPHRGSWLVWSVIAIVAATSHAADGASWSLLVLTVQAAGTTTILAVGLSRGTGWLTTADAALLAVAGLGVIGWQVSSDPIAASVCAAVADGAGLVAMVPKVWAAARSETLSTYVLAASGGLLTLLALPSWEANLVLFPAYFLVGNAAMSALIWTRRRPVAGLGWSAPSPNHLAPPTLREAAFARK